MIRNDGGMIDPKLAQRDLERLRQSGALAAPYDRQMSVRARARESILDSIESGEWPPGSKLPPERQLAEQLDVSRTTLRLVMLELTAHGLISPLQGSGYYVAPTAEEVQLAIGRVRP
jgi:DNA-binding FadR family transcriptional regulator